MSLPTVGSGGSRQSARYARAAFVFVLVLGLVLALAGSAFAGEILWYPYSQGTFAWPSDSQWQPISTEQEGIDLSASMASLDFVGSPQYPGLYAYSDASYFYYRARVALDTTVTSSTYRDSIWFIIDSNKDGKADYAFNWDSKSNDITKHGMEMQANPTISPSTWAELQFDDYDQKPADKVLSPSPAPWDFNLSGDAYCRTVDQVPVVNPSWGSSKTKCTFVDIAISKSYLLNNNTSSYPLPTTGDWYVQLGSRGESTDHNNISTDIGRGQGPSSVISAASWGVHDNTVSYLASAHGSIVGSATQAVAYGSMTSAVTAVADTGHHFVSWSDGVTTPIRTDTGVVADKTVTASFAPDQYVVKTFCSTHGTLTPGTNQTVDYGSTPSFSIAADPGSHLIGVSIDGSTSVGTPSNYTFTPISADSTIQAMFAVDKRAGTTRYDDTDAGFAYSGSWITLPKWFHWDGSYQYSRTTSQSVTIRFVGTGIDYITNLDRTYGIASVSLDGGAPVDVDLYAATLADRDRNQPQTRVWSTTGLTYGAHTLVISNSGRKNSASSNTFVGIDAVDIEGTMLDATTETVTPTADIGGSISPNTPQSVRYGTDCETFTITPDADHRVFDVVVDGVSMGPISSYKFSAVTQPHTISATFAKRFDQTDAKLAYSASWNSLARSFHWLGSYAYSGAPSARIAVRFHGTGVSYVTNKDTMYGIAKVTLDSNDPIDIDLYSPTRNTAQQVAWTAKDLADADHLLLIEYTGRKNPESTGYFVGLDAVDVAGDDGAIIDANMTITPSATTGGTIATSTVQTIPYGLNGPTFKITPNLGYHVSDVLVDGESVGARSSYSFGTVLVNHTIEARFAIDTRSITATAAAGGSISPSATTTVNYGSNRVFTITPETGYRIVDVRVDGASVGAVGTYEFSNVTADHTIAATFARDSYVRVEQDDTRIAYSGTWSSLARAFHSGGSYAFSGRPGGKITAKFHGTGIAYVTNKDTMYGIARVTLDGGVPIDVDLFNPVRNSARAEVWHANGLEDTDHTVTIEYTGTKNASSTAYFIGLDALDVNGVLLDANTP